MSLGPGGSADLCPRAGTALVVAVQRGSFKWVPVLITTAVVALVTFCETPFGVTRLGVLRRIEWMTYDWRLRTALNHGRTPVNTNLFALLIDEPSQDAFRDGGLGLSVSYPFPRLVYGRVVKELKTEGAAAVGFDILFDSPRTSSTAANRAVGTSDAFFAQEIKNAGNVVLAVAQYGNSLIFPDPILTPRAAFADISAEQDPDGVLRRVKPYLDDPGHGRLWHLGIVLAAKAMGLDLDHAEVGAGEVVLRGPGGLRRSLPLDDKGNLLINWSVPNQRMPRASLFIPFAMDRFREQSPMDLKGFRDLLRTNDVFYPEGDTPMTNKIVVIGSTMVGNNVSDRGATPLDKLDFLLGKHWNVANSVLENRFIRQTPFWVNFLIIAALAVLSGWLTCRIRIFSAMGLIVLITAAYCGLAWLVFLLFGLWAPMVTPALGALFLTHGSMVSYLVVVEQNERRRIKAVFSKIVAPEVVNTLLESEKLALGGARRQITVYFADIRGFTEMTDTVQARAEEFVLRSGLSGPSAEEYFDRQAGETLQTVNLYLAAIADTIKKHNGTLDKYIGDCVMAFWGAPVPNDKHALACVRAAIEAQRLIHALNRARFAENKQREQENATRAAAGQPPLPMLPMLTLGTGINTGAAMVGLMGSDDHILNYTVFGREVNLASRFESLSGRGRILIGEETYLHLQRDDPALAATCVEQAPAMIKGFSAAVRSFEVPWKEAAPAPVPALVASGPAS